MPFPQSWVTLFSVSINVILQVMNSLCSPLSENVFLIFMLKAIFIEYGLPVLYCFASHILKNSILLHSYILIWELGNSFNILLLKYNVLSLRLLQFFPSSLVYDNEYDVSRYCNFLSLFCLGFLTSWKHGLIHFYSTWKNFSSYFLFPAHFCA